MILASKHMIFRPIAMLLGIEAVAN